MKKKLISLFLIGFFFLTGSIYCQVPEVATAILVQTSLNELKNSLNAIVTQVDTVMRNRIEDIFNRIDKLMKEIEEMRKRMVTDINKFRHGFTKDVHEVMYFAKDLSRNLSSDLYIKVNQTLINIANVIDQLPLTKKMAPYVFAVDPSVINVTDTGKNIKIYGYFRDLSERLPINIETLGAKYLITKPGIGNSISIDLPNDIDLNAYDGRPFKYTIKMQYKKSFLLFFKKKKSLVYEDKIFVRKNKPYFVSLNSISENPASYENIGLHHEAHSNNTTSHSIQRTISARDMFTSTFSNAGLYDLNSVKYVNVSQNVGSGRPCNCTSVSAQFHGWDQNNLSYSLTSSCMGDHWQGFDHHGGGCSNADIWIDMTVNAHKLGVPDISTTASENLKRNSAQDFGPCPPLWKNTFITINYDDGIGNIWSQIIFVEPTNPGNSIIKTQGGIDINAGSGRILINTRD